MKIPVKMQEKYDKIAPLIITFCNEKLNDEYKDLCLRLLVKLCRKKASPLLGGRSNTLATGIIHAIGSNNFIFDKTQKLHFMKKQIFTIILTLIFLSCDISAETNTTYIFEGRYSSTVAYRVEGNLIYNGRYSAEVSYRKENNLIYTGRYSSTIAYRIENNLIYIGRYGSEVFGRIENNLIYKGRYSSEVLYRVER